MGDFVSVFDEAGASAEAEQAARALAVAKQASAGIAGFLYQAANEDDFGHRVAMAEDDLLKAAAAGGISVHALVAEHAREFGLLMEAKKTTAAMPPDWGLLHEYDDEQGSGPRRCPTCNGARAVPAQGHEAFHEVSNGQVRCPQCYGHGVLPSHGVSDVGEPMPYADEGTLSDRFYGSDYHASLKRTQASLENIRTALAEGQDPLEWLEQQGAGEGQAEKPSEAGIEAVQGSKKVVPPFSREAEATSPGDSGFDYRYKRENLSPGEQHAFGPTHIDESGVHPAVHTFGSTGEAYDQSQWDDRIKDGDVLHVPSEGVTGFLQEAWPVALHHNGSPGAFHGLSPEAGEDPHSFFGGGAKGQEYGLKDYSDTLAKAKAVHEGMGKQGAVLPFSREAFWGKGKPAPAPVAAPDPLAGRAECPSGHRTTTSMGDGSGKHKCFTCDGIFTPKTASGLGMPDGPMKPDTDPSENPVDPVPGSDPVGPQTVQPFEQFMPLPPTNQVTTKPRQMPGDGGGSAPGDGGDTAMDPAANGADAQTPETPKDPAPPVQATRHRAYLLSDVMADVLEANPGLGERTAYLLAKRVVEEFPLTTEEKA